MKTLLEVLQAGTDYLARQGCDEARATMQHLLAHVLHCNRTALYSQFDRPVEEAELAPLRELLKRRAAGELVEMVLKKIPDHPVRILDMGTGSGVIGVTLALELKERAGEVVLADISPQALDLALENAMRLGARVSTIQTDLFANIPPEKTGLLAGDADSAPEGKKGEDGRNMLFDVIVANLPYIAEGEKLAPEVMKDPHTALFGGPKGWEIIERFLSRARDYLNEDGFVALEIGYDQASVVTQIMDGYGYNYIEVLKDISGVARFPFGYR